MAACDACVSLRAPTMGETSGSAIRALSLGDRSSSATSAGSPSCPTTVALKVPVDERRDPGARRRARAARASEPTQLAMGDAARAYVSASTTSTHVATSYAAALEEAAGGTRRRGRSRRRGRAGRRRDRHRAGYARSRRSSPGGSTRSDWRATADRDPAPPQSRSRLARVPVWAWLAALVVVSAVFRSRSARRVVARGSWSTSSSTPTWRRASPQTGHFLDPRRAHGAYGFVYPLLLSPAWRRSARCPTCTPPRGDRLGADVARRDPGVPPRAPRREPIAALARRPARRRDPVD